MTPKRSTAKPAAKTSRSAARSPKARPVAANNPFTEQLPVRVDLATVQGLDAWVDALNAKSVGPRWTRSTVIRVTLERVLRERAPTGELP